MRNRFDKQTGQKFGELLGKRYAKSSPLPPALMLFLEAAAFLTHAEAINGLVQLRGDFAALQQRDPGACVLVLGRLSRELGFSRRDLEAGLGLHLQYDLDQQLFAALRALEPAVRHGLLFVYQVVAWVNANRSTHEALTPRFVASRLRALGFDFARHRPSRMRWDRSRVFPSQVDTDHTRLLPSPEEPHENGRNTQ